MVVYVGIRERRVGVLEYAVEEEEKAEEDGGAEDLWGSEKIEHSGAAS